ncbi:MAG TPA: hypothetical protein VFU69_03160 [Ktedonobacterales bacterium]|nr:hypothetical protein [Ktedonobacterales bacterium]
MSLLGQPFGLGLTGTQPHPKSDHADLYWLGMGAIFILFSIFSLIWSVIFYVAEVNDLGGNTIFGIVISAQQEGSIYDFLTNLSLVLFTIGLAFVIISLVKRFLMRRATKP